MTVRQKGKKKEGLASGVGGHAKNSTKEKRTDQCVGKI